MWADDGDVVGQASGLFLVPHDVTLGIIGAIALVDHRDDAVTLDDLGVIENVLEFADAAFHVALFVLGRVIAGIFLQITLGAGGLDFLGDLDAAAGGEVLELRAQSVVGGAGQLLSCHGDKTIPAPCCGVARCPRAVSAVACDA